MMLQIRNLRASVGGREILRGVDLDVGAGRQREADEQHREERGEEGRCGRGAGCSGEGARPACWFWRPAKTNFPSASPVKT